MLPNVIYKILLHFIREIHIPREFNNTFAQVKFYRLDVRNRHSTITYIIICSEI